MNKSTPGKAKAQRTSLRHPTSEPTKPIRAQQRRRRGLPPRSSRSSRESGSLDGLAFITAITDNLPGMVGYWDRNLRCRFANAPYKEWFGVTPEQLIGMHISELLGEALYQRNHPFMLEALAGRPQMFERTLIKADGSTGYTQAHYVPHRIGSEVVGFFVLVSDMTARKQAELALLDLKNQLEVRVAERTAELLESDQRFQLMVDAVQDYAIYFLNADGTVASWTKAAERLKGYAASEVIGQHFSCFYTDSQPTGHDLLKQAQLEGQCESEGWHQRKDGSRFMAHAVITALRDPQGQLRGFSNITRDVTAIREAEALQRNLNIELERRVHERTEQLEHANRELEAFSYSVSHDLRAPLRHIDGFIDLLRHHASDALDPTSCAHLQTIASSARQMGCLIDDLLAFSRTSRGEMHRQTVELHPMVSHVQQEVMLEAASRTIDWQIDRLPAVRGDPAMLHQMWLNLLANAAKYTRRQPAACIEVRFEGTRDGLHHFAIKDNGVGFDQRFAHKLFGVFQRLHRDDEFEGTGIGLALVQRVVQRHGGTITAEGHLDAGATFCFTLPAP